MVGESFHRSGCWGEDSNHIRLGATVQKLLRLFAFLPQMEKRKWKMKASRDSCIVGGLIRSRSPDRWNKVDCAELVLCNTGTHQQHEFITAAGSEFVSSIISYGFWQPFLLIGNAQPPTVWLLRFEPGARVPFSRPHYVLLVSELEMSPG